MPTDRERVGRRLNSSLDQMLVLHGVTAHEQVVPDGHGGEQAALLWHMNDPPQQPLARAELVERAAPVDDAAPPRPKEAADALEHCALPGAVRSDEARQRAWRH